MKKLLVVDLLAEREAFGKKGVEEIVSHFPEHEVLLWAPHTDDCVDYQFGKRIDSPEDSDVIVITGSRRNVSQWEPWMDDVADLIRTCTVPLYGICFGHQIICKALGGEVIRADSSSNLFLKLVTKMELQAVNYSLIKTTLLTLEKWKLSVLQNTVELLYVNTRLDQLSLFNTIPKQ